MNKKQITTIVSISFIIILILLTACEETSVKTNNTNSEDNLTEFNNPLSHTCPHGIENETTPRCGLYQDKNSDGICDLSQ